MAQQTIDIGAAPNDGTGDPIRDAFDKCNDNFTELYGSLAGLLDFQGATDCSANPNYPAASQGDIYIVSVAGKIGGASGKVVEVGDFYLALADNAGGTEASVGTSWAVLQANITGGSVISELDDIPDVNAPTPADGDVLTWDSTPGEWVPLAPTGGSNALDDLTDVDAPTPSDGDVLTFDSGSGDWVPASPSGGGDLTLISEVVTSGSQAHVTFSAISGSYRDLVLIVRGRADKAATFDDMYIQFNGDTGANYDYLNQDANNTTVNYLNAVADTEIMTAWIPAASGLASVASPIEIVIPFYATAYHKTAMWNGMLKTSNALAGLYLRHGRGWWRSTAAITSVKVAPMGSNFENGSIVSLYGRN